MAVTRAQLGVVYTPREVCEPMVRRALEPLIAGKTPDEILALRIADPAIGAGAFVVEIVRVLAEAIGGPERVARRRVAARCVVGVDIDPAAVAAARAAVEDFVGAPVPSLADHLRAGDALAFDWTSFGALDAVIGNPPYVRQERLGAHKAALRGRASYDGVADLYVYFVELAHRIVRPSGRYCLIVPNKWMTAAYGRALRGFLAREASVDGLVDFGRALPLFDDADAFPCIVWGTVGAPRTAPIVATRAGDRDTVASALATTASSPRARWTAEPWHIDSPDDAALIDRWTRRWPALGAVIGRPSRGVVTGCNRAFVIDAATRARLVDAEPAAAALIRPFVRGRDLRCWRPVPIDRFVVLVDHGVSLAHLPHVVAHLAQFRAALEPKPRSGSHGPGRKPGRYRWYELQDPVVPLATSRAPRMLYQDIQTAPACAFDPSGELVPDTTVWILPSADPFVLAVLNSPLYGWYARRRFPPALNGAVRPKLEYMRALPLATPSPALRARVETLVAARLERDPEMERGGFTPTRLALDRALADAVFDAYEVAGAARIRILRSASGA
jgi:hypothetical protein